MNGECEECVLPEIQTYDGKSCKYYGMIKLSSGTWYGNVKEYKRDMRGIMAYSAGFYKDSLFEGEF